MPRKVVSSGINLNPCSASRELQSGRTAKNQLLRLFGLVHGSSPVHPASHPIRHGMAKN